MADRLKRLLEVISLGYKKERNGIKRISLKGYKNYGHLGHFIEDKFLQEGHNTVPPQVLLMAAGMAKGMMDQQNKKKEEKSEKLADPLEGLYALTSARQKSLMDADE